MEKTIFITGTSSGIGKASALYFAEQGWNVAATMRSPEKHNDFIQHPRTKTYRVDVTDTRSIATAISDAIKDFGQIDVLVNNAGFSVFGAFECASEEEVQNQLNTNLLGVMNVTRAILPHFRQRKEGRIIALSSIGGLAAFPLFTLYHASKWAVEGFMESLHYELKPFNIKVKIVEPGAVNTHLTANTIESKSSTLKDYDQYVERVKKNLLNANPNSYDQPIDIARAIMRAATDQGTRMRYPVGNANIILILRRLLPLSWFHGFVSRSNGM
jgi:NAD(P)-dependent dehydrogenase (short-subunit alcohol dehydrogenase family)